MTQATTSYSIHEGDPLDSRVRALIAELDAFNSALYPAESNHFDAPETLAGLQRRAATMRGSRWQPGALLHRLAEVERAAAIKILDRSGLGRRGNEQRRERQRAPPEHQSRPRIARAGAAHAP